MPVSCHKRSPFHVSVRGINYLPQRLRGMVLSHPLKRSRETSSASQFLEHLLLDLRHMQTVRPPSVRI